MATMLMLQLRCSVEVNHYQQIIAAKQRYHLRHHHKDDQGRGPVKLSNKSGGLEFCDYDFFVRIFDTEIELVSLPL